MKLLGVLGDVLGQLVPFIRWWREILIALLAAAVLVQQVRVAGAKASLAKMTGERDVLATEKIERSRRDAMRDATNLRNKERTDEEYAAARGRAARVVVRDGSRIKPPAVAVAGGGEEPTLCFDRGRLVAELTAWLQRDADRISELSQRLGQRFTGVAREGEGVAAAFRACRAYTLSVQ